MFWSYYMKQFLLLIFFLSVFQLNAQETSTNTAIKEVRELMFGLKKKRAIQKIDSLLRLDIDKNDKLLLQTLKVEVLVNLLLFDEALVLANKSIADVALSDLLRTKLLLERSLIYEYVNQFEASRKDLESVHRYFEKDGVVKNEQFGEYLYRTASWYRVQDKDSMARVYALRANDFGEEKDYKDVIATANMILGFLVEDQTTTQKFRYTQKSLENFKQTNDNDAIVAMTFNHAKYFKIRGEYDKAMAYLDTLNSNIKDDKELLFRSSSAELKSQIFEEKGQLDSALVYFKKFKELAEEEFLIEQNIKVSEIQVKFEFEKKLLENNLLNENLEKEISQNRKLMIATAILLALFSVVGILLYYLSVRNRRIAQQSGEISETNKKLSITLSEKQILLKELNHRVKNNLALIISLIKFHAQDTEDAYYKNKFQHLEKRINAIAMAHEQFIYSENQIDVTLFNLQEYLQKIANSLVQTTNTPIAYTQNIEDISVTIDTALPIGILCNELINNSIKHADVLDNSLIIELTITEKNDSIEILYTDNGSTFIAQSHKKSLGLFIIESMVLQLDGHYERVDSTYTITLSIKK